MALKFPDVSGLWPCRECMRHCPRHKSHDCGKLDHRECDHSDCRGFHPLKDFYLDPLNPERPHRRNGVNCKRQHVRRNYITERKRLDNESAELGRRIFEVWPLVMAEWSRSPERAVKFLADRYNATTLRAMNREKAFYEIDVDLCRLALRELEIMEIMDERRRMTELDAKVEEARRARVEQDLMAMKDDLDEEERLGRRGPGWDSWEGTNDGTNGGTNGGTNDGTK